MARTTLLTFVGHRDPYHTDQHEDGQLKGPVLTVLDGRKFDRVVLFSRPHRRDQVERTRAVLRELQPKLTLEIHELALSDSTSHAEILARLRPVLSRIRRARPDDAYSISLIAGTPEIHACWVLLTASGEFSARLLNLRRTVHNGLAGPHVLRDLDWNEPLAAITPETLALLSARRDRWDDAELQGPAASVPRHYFVRRSLEQAVQLSRHATPLLIVGEPGTQKQHLAALVHQAGARASGPMVVVNCATLPEPLFESALFGDDGDEQAGKLRQADGGTLVLIKIQHVPAAVLALLFKSADQGCYYGTRTSVPIKANVRLIGTTDRDLEAEVRHGRFPAEVWRRMQASMVRLPPLRERSGDITLLAREELERLNRTLPRPKRFSPAALAKLESHSWPSNISELRRVVEQAVVNAEQPTIQPEHIDLDLSVNMANVFAHAVPRIREGFSIEDYLRTIKHELVRSVLRKTRGNQSQAARLLGVTPQAISKLMKSATR
ncbi:sigma-54-dependent transcriptional regulator [Horticoccus sp. 23ND18S-11]|uniref:sigma-54-dependent transcriptional regulator n=1 Tax=Horticoccus sp. 23ND18S-11 TaxID=3391832 RepID=UPI0039C90AD8